MSDALRDTVVAVFSLTLAALGLSYLLRARAWARLYSEWTSHPGRVIPTASLMVVAGLFVAVAVDDWSSTWPIFITAFGWMMAIEGAILALQPSLIGGFTHFLGSNQVVFIRLGGLLILGLGGLLCWEYLLEGHF